MASYIFVLIMQIAIVYLCTGVFKEFHLTFSLDIDARFNS